MYIDLYIYVEYSLWILKRYFLNKIIIFICSIIRILLFFMSVMYSIPIYLYCLLTSNCIYALSCCIVIYKRIKLWKKNTENHDGNLDAQICCILTLIYSCKNHINVIDE